MLDSFLQLEKMYQFKLRHLFKKSFLSLALWYSGEWESLGFRTQEDAILWLANKIGSRCEFNPKQTLAMLAPSPLIADLYPGNIKTLIDESAPVRLEETTECIVMFLATGHSFTLGEVSKKFGLDRKNTHETLNRLVQKGLVLKINNTYRIKASKYCLRYLNYLIYDYYPLANNIYNTNFCTTKFTKELRKRIRKEGFIHRGRTTHFTKQPPVNPYTDFHPSIVALLDNGRIHIDPQGVKFFYNNLDVDTLGELHMIAKPHDEPQRIYTDFQLETGKYTFHKQTYNIARLLNSQFDTQFDTDEPSEYYRFKCPFHGGDSPSFYVWADGHYHCYHGGCGANGAWLQGLFMKLYDISLDDAIDIILPYCNPQTPWDKPDTNGSYGPPQLSGERSGREKMQEAELRGAQEMYKGVYTFPELRVNWEENCSSTASYLFGRGFNAKTLEHFRVHDFYKFEKRYPVWVPLVDNGVVYGSMRRAIEDYVKPKYLTSAGVAKSRHLYGEIAQGSVPFLVEGVTDAWTVWQYGYSDFGALLGCELSETQALLLRMLSVRAVIIATDMDAAGQSTYKAALEKLSPFGIGVFRYAYTAKDVAMLGRTQFWKQLEPVLLLASKK